MLVFRRPKRWQSGLPGRIYPAPTTQLLDWARLHGVDRWPAGRPGCTTTADDRPLPILLLPTPTHSPISYSKPCRWVGSTGWPAPVTMCRPRLSPSCSSACTGSAGTTLDTSARRCGLRTGEGKEVPAGAERSALLMPRTTPNFPTPPFLTLAGGAQELPAGLRAAG